MGHHFVEVQVQQQLLGGGKPMSSLLGKSHHPNLWIVQFREMQNVKRLFLAKTGRDLIGE